MIRNGKLYQYDRFKSQHILFIVEGKKEISMHQSHPLADTLEQLKGVASQEGISHQTHSILALLQTQIPSFLRTHSHVQEQLAQKESENKRINRSLRKTNLKLEKKNQECQELTNELQRVTRMYTQKIDKLLKYQENQLSGTDRKEANLWKDKIRNRKSVGTDCQLLNQTLIKELSSQKKLLKDKLEQTQQNLLQEQKFNQTLWSRLRQIEEDQSESVEEIKDNSTIDADSLKGDPFLEQEEEWEEEFFEEKEEKPQEKSWWRKLWNASWNTYNSLVKKYE